MKVENAVWEPVRKGSRVLSESCLAVRSLQVGDTKRIVHDDLRCTNSYCYLAQEICRLRKTNGWEISYYHEEYGTMVIRRTK